ncbi:peroxidase-related enzyme [Kordiimonas sp. SCSIO 12610]|uniref:peroxidase-related enzyme n=1 Tax=Kordiimonas sp. SCSIO 12610 TaxID=2829597 RepID=UPI002108C319|nr:peroxidase-related enzyme [Kordiimonas sp. SCSIO 12610]UTW55759.1 peroxidase-related enzyme [Kordiimonas sp. SCSIO 12610]
MTWIQTISFASATGKLKDIYKRVTGPDNNVDNILMAHSLRPHTLEGHMAIYKAVLHHYGNSIPKWMLEVLGVYVSLMNNCTYCVEHHFSGLSRLLKDQGKADQIRSALEEHAPDLALEAKYVAACQYARKLTENPKDMSEYDVRSLKDAGFDDGEVLEINQVVAYFAYANRTVLGLGINTDGDVIGLSPNSSENPDDWSHS